MRIGLWSTLLGQEIYRLPSLDELGLGGSLRQGGGVGGVRRECILWEDNDVRLTSFETVYFG